MGNITPASILPLQSLSIPAGASIILRCLPQRASAAFLAIFLRLAGVRLSALALPPFNPPMRPSATAAGFFSGWASEGNLINDRLRNAVYICA